MKWSDSDIDFLRKNYGKLTKREIATALNRGESAVTAKITKLKLAQISSWTPEQDAFLRNNAGKGWGWCANEMGRSITSIYNRVRRLGIQLKMLRAGELARIRELHAKGLMNAEIGADLGVSDECVRRWLKLWKLPMNKRDERKRMATLARNLKEKYGVESIAKARKIRKRRLREASLALGLRDLASRIGGKNGNGR